MAVKQPKSMLAGHTAGMFADMTLDGPEIGTLVTVVDRAKNLPNRKTMGKQDPYCAMRLGKLAKKTETDRRGGQTPKWDQELRFTVHDSPDYYKLKVSVFNDDKKTDLIGEAYVGLHDLIKPGGGSNDLWHQLNYKGKYAGEIRMEMTYYDIRPREEKPAEKRRYREKAASVISDATSSVSGPRQLGPREVRRRPLPASPGADVPSPPTTPQSQPPPPPPKIPLPQSIPDHVSTSRSEQYTISSHPQDYDAGPVPQSSNYFQSTTQQHYEPGLEYQDFDSGHRHNRLSDQYGPVVPSPALLPMPTQFSSSHPETSDMWSEPGRRHSENYESTTTLATAYDSPPPLPHASHSAPEVPQYRPHRTSVSPAKGLQYRDSPLRHSVSQQEVPQDFVDEPDTYDVPPPPPRHRDSGARNHQSDYSPSTYAPKPLRPAPRRPSIDERSPLQTIERDFDPSLALMHDPSRHSSYDMYTEPAAGSMHTPVRHGSYDAYPQPLPLASRSHSRQGSFDPYREPETLSRHAPEPQANYDDQQERSLIVQRQYAVQDQTDVYGRRSSRNAFVQEQQSSPSPHRNGHSDSLDEHQVHGAHVEADSRGLINFPQSQANAAPNYSTPIHIRPSPQRIIPPQIPGYALARKAISPGPYPTDCSRRLSEIPFGPDDYDVLNPASSPATNEHTQFETPEQSKASARLREANALRDQGPIIGNDGRVIDPSDHLPSDTWAPEPERKQRKPEHVIHIRTKNDIRGPTTPGSSPVSIRTSTHRSALHGPSASPSPVSTPPSAGRSRLQKSIPARPLPVQPYQQALPTSSQPRESPLQQPRNRNSYHDKSPGVERPPLSEYQVPVSSSYSPRGTSYQINNSHHQPTPPKMAYVEDYFPSRSSDPLAAEMSMIDIGPSRGGRTALRPSRGY